MGNNQGDAKADADYHAYLSSMQLVRKENSENLGRNFDLYRPDDLPHEESLVLVIEIVFDQNEFPNEDQNTVFNRFKDEVNQRKAIKSRYFSQLLYVGYKVVTIMCLEHLVCRLALEFSDENLFKVLNDRLMYRSSTQVPELPSPAAFQWFLASLIEGLLALHQRNMLHGYLMPVNVLVYNKTSKQPLYKLLDVALVSRYKKWV